MYLHKPYAPPQPTSFGIISDIGIGTFVDPRQQGGKLNEVTKEDLIKLVEFENKEYLYYKAIAPDIAFIRATTCDSEGYATFEDEVMYLDALVIAQAVHNNGGIVMMQVQKMVKKATLHPKSVRIPGYLVDIVVVDPIKANCMAVRRLTALFLVTSPLMKAPNLAYP